MSSIIREFARRIFEEMRAIMEIVEGKCKKTVLFEPVTWERIIEAYKDDNCSTRSEFIERAVNFYCGYLDAVAADAYLPGVLASTLEGHLNLFADRVNRLLFKMAVETDMMMNIIAADSNVDYVKLEQLRSTSVHNVKSTNGQFSFKEILRFQKER